MLDNFYLLFFIEEPETENIFLSSFGQLSRVSLRKCGGSFFLFCFREQYGVVFLSLGELRYFGAHDVEAGASVKVPWP